MKRKLTALSLSILFASFSLQAQKHYQSINLKTNVLNMWNIGIELPIKENYSLEFNTHWSWGVFHPNTIYRDKRLNLKYHFTVPSIRNSENSVYILAGLHHKFMVKDKFSKSDNVQEFSKFNALRTVIGLGMRYDAFDIWLAAESSIVETDNYTEFRNTSGDLLSFERWKSHGALSLGVAWNFLSFNPRQLPKFNDILKVKL